MADDAALRPAGWWIPSVLAAPSIGSVAYTLTVAFLLLSSLRVGYVAFLIRRKRQDKYPPFAPGGMWSHLKMATAAEYPWWLLDVVKEVGSPIVQMSLPVSPTKHFVIVGDPDVFRTIMADPTSTKPVHIYKAMRKITGAKTLLTMNGSGWHAKRKATAPAFSSRHVRKMTRVAMEKTDQWVEQTLNQHSENDTSFDVVEEMLGVVLSALTETAFEYAMSEAELASFHTELRLAIIEFTRKSAINPLRPLLGGFIPERRRAYIASERLQSKVRHIMRKYIENDQSVDGTIIQLVMDSDAFPNEEERVSQLLEFLLAGHDTTAFSISWILLCLARSPTEQSLLRDALKELSPESWSSSEHLKRVVKEGMRLYPVARSVRVTGRDIMTSCGIIPKGSICSLMFMLLFRNPDIFDDPNSYVPSRWENPTREMLDAFAPFSLGKQNCIGQSLAQAETFVIVARICTEFELSVDCEGSSDFSITLKPVGVRLKARKLEMEPKSAQILNKVCAQFCTNVE